MVPVRRTKRKPTANNKKEDHVCPSHQHSYLENSPHPAYIQHCDTEYAYRLDFKFMLFRPRNPSEDE